MHHTYANILGILAAGVSLLAHGASVCGQEPGLIGHWIFDPEHAKAQTVKAVHGGRDVTIDGPARFRTSHAVRPLLLDGEMKKVTLAYDAGAMPKRAITVTAWLCVEKTVEWMNLFGAEAGGKGWQLGCRQSSFSFGVSGKGAKGFTHLRDRESLEWGRWHHVAGTYDGKAIKVFVDGRCVNTSDAQKGPLEVPDKATWSIGTFGTYAPRMWLHELRLYDRALGEAEIAARHETKRKVFGEPLIPKVGPILRQLDRHTVRIRWQTDEAMPSVLLYGTQQPVTRRAVDTKPRTEHAVTISDIRPQRMYYYRIASAQDDKAQTTRQYEFDSTFDYAPPQVSFDRCPWPKDEMTDVYAAAAERILEQSDVRKGWCIDLGCGEGRLAWEIARQSELKILAIDDDPQRVRATRQALDEAGVYGPRIMVQRASLDKPPHAQYLANLIVSDRVLRTGKLPTPAKEVHRLLRPFGGVAYLGRPAALQDEGTVLDRSRLEAWAKDGGVTGVQYEKDDGVWAVIRRGELPGVGWWSHQYGDATNATTSQDERVSGPLEVLWFGRPGPRPMIDRGTRAPAPVAVHGRLFIQGDRWLFGLDAYNGAMLWARSIPDLRRANIPRDGSNMVAAADALYVAVRDRCWQIDPTTGDVVRTFALPRPAKDVRHDWGYLACTDDLLFGSAVKHGGLFLGADGEWYDRPDEESLKVVSDYVFALDRKTGETRWVYRAGALINATLTMGDGRLYFVESRSPAAAGVGAGRLGEELTSDRYMVSLNARTGKKHWEHYRYFKQSKWVFYLAYAKNTLVALDTTDKYHIYGFDAKSGDPLWKQEYNFRRNHHGGAMQHPVIVGDTIFCEPRAFKLRSGEPVAVSKPANGCGTVSASGRALFFRDGVHSMYDIGSRKLRKFPGIRPSCWLTLIPAGGLLLAPEGSAGCHCAWPIQTTVAFAPQDAEKP